MIEHEPTCSCYEGYELINNKCEDLNECLNNPCHHTAICENIPGNFICSCPQKMIGDPIIEGCRDPNECYSDADCHSSATCINSKCLNPCETGNVCGIGASCKTIDHKITCQCPSHTIGDAKVECKQIECTEDLQCSLENQCVDHKCVNPCSLMNACGRNSECNAVNHARSCSCLPGFTGNSVLGCVRIQSCSSDRQCPNGARCYNGICSVSCSSNRDCLDNELCIQNVCQPTCKSNSTCGEEMYCHNNICLSEPKCLSDHDCNDDESCSEDSAVGRKECKPTCNTKLLCGRNSECIARQHTAECQCKPGYFHDGNYCRKIECSIDNDCSVEKKCENFICKNVCLIESQCGANSVCVADNHRQRKKHIN